MNNFAKMMELYRRYTEDNTNIIDYINKLDKNDKNSLEAILISYDLQAGSYTERHQQDPDFRANYMKRLADLILEYDIRGKILEPGVGEANSLVALLNHLPSGRFEQIHGFDLSWSRSKYARAFCDENGYKNAIITTGDLFHMPFIDDHFDLVFTTHAVEPNGGHEKEILQELYRVTRQWLILLEPAYELSDAESQARMRRLGYVTNLYQTAIDLGYDVICHELYGRYFKAVNQTGITIIKKKTVEDENKEHGLACPITTKPMRRRGDAYYCEESMLAYPILQDIPCLRPENAIVASKFLEGL